MQFSALLPARTEAEVAILKLDLRPYRHSATAACFGEQCKALRDLVLETEGDNVYMLPRSRELNVDKMLFRSFSIADKYCG